ncbi:hypothetical protein ILYODFUR_009457 [Ilyodon furcidens]|uniref:Uncharacterized protein n=1 Tax=Ilyodon furcidens TaxID=33524 RepID=A0ABV0V1N7_9TELE
MGTTQRPQCRSPRDAATSPQAPPAAIYTGADPALEPETTANHSPSRGPTEQGGPGPSKQPTTGSEPAHTKAPSPGHRESPIDQRAETECGGEEIGPTFDGGPKLIQEREQPKTQTDTKTGAHSHNQTFPPSKTHNNERRTLTHTPHTYTILPGPGTGPASDTSPQQPPVPIWRGGHEHELFSIL